MNRNRRVFFENLVSNGSEHVILRRCGLRGLARSSGLLQASVAFELLPDGAMFGLSKRKPPDNRYRYKFQCDGKNGIERDEQ